MKQKIEKYQQNLMKFNQYIIQLKTILKELALTLKIK